MDFLSLSSPGLYKILCRSRFLSESRSKSEVLEKLREILPKDLIEKAEFDSKNYSSSLKKMGAEIVSYFDQEYPSLLKEIYDPPPNLFCFGNIGLLKLSYLAVVGTRKASPITLHYSKLIPNFVYSLGLDGIISGLALGVDAAAMFLTLEQGMPVIGVMGTGPEKEYPQENRNLYKRMKSSDNALVITECPPGFEVRKYAFPKRNRIITGISPSLLMMEAPTKSGALSSASNAISQDRDVFVFDHPLQTQNQGGKKLLSDGATPVLFDKYQTEGEKIFHLEEILPSNFEEVPGMLARLGKNKLNGNWIDIGNGFIRSVQ
ncbi:DNA-processing protein DprA [Leptospira neocaledonica]|uniref:DNA processing protein DprA n=1 Tax=Leptospira neocaledonica TaxID=2023192 RepID=A0A2N0A2P3_9LEPT|nr:DNA-processing protein DprA [Leptospira neocaledonica]PJZ78602.1 DNA processing protein DprA [Leptospira neocaledonica]